MKNINTNNIIKCALYIRVSTIEQAKHGYSLDSQKDNLIEYCKQKGYQVYKIYADEGKTARTKLNNRTELLKLIEDAKNGNFNRIVFWRLDRWFRNIKDYYKVQEILDKYNVDWECTSEEYNTTTSNGRLHLNIKLSIAQNESDQTSDRIKFNFENMVKNGRAITGNQAVPLGYMVTGNEKDKHVVKNPDTEQIAIDMLDHIMKSGSIRQTLLYINEKYDLRICYDSMRHYLMNTKYYGYYRGIDNYCDAYITKEQFDEIQSLVHRNIKSNKRHDYIFSGLIKCPKCGCRLAGFTSIATKNNGVRYKYPCYRCNHSYNDNLCNYRKRIVENTLEQFLLSNIKSILSSEMIEIETINNKEQIQKKLDPEKIKIKLNRLTDLYIEGKILREKYDLEFEKLNRELVEATEEKTQEKVDLSRFQDLMKTDILNMYNKLNNTSKRNFWAYYIEYIIKNEDDSYYIEFKKNLV